MARRNKIWGLFRSCRQQQEPADEGRPRRKNAHITVRKYKRRDREVVIRLAEESFRGVCLDENIEEQFGQIGDTWQEHKKGAVDYDLVNNASDAFVAELEGRVVGFICTRLLRYQLIGHVANMAVAPEFQGIGVGKALMSAVLDHFRDRGMIYARIETLQQNAKAQNFYPSLGFKEVARQIFYFMEL